MGSYRQLAMAEAEDQAHATAAITLRMLRGAGVGVRPRWPHALRVMGGLPTSKMPLRALALTGGDPDLQNIVTIMRWSE